MEPYSNSEEIVPWTDRQLVKEVSANPVASLMELCKVHPELNLRTWSESGWFSSTREKRLTQIKMEILLPLVQSNSEDIARLEYTDKPQESQHLFLDHVPAWSLAEQVSRILKFKLEQEGNNSAELPAHSSSMTTGQRTEQSTLPSDLFSGWIEFSDNGFGGAGGIDLSRLKSVRTISKSDSEALQAVQSHETERGLVISGVSAGIPIQFLQLGVHRFYRELSTIDLYLRLRSEGGIPVSLERSSDATQWELDLLDLGVSSEVLYSRPSGESYNRMDDGVNDIGALEYLPKISEILGSSSPLVTSPSVESAVLAILEKSKSRDSRIVEEFENYRIEIKSDDSLALRTIIEELNTDLEMLKNKVLLPLMALPSDTIIQMKYENTDHIEGSYDFDHTNDPTTGRALDILKVEILRETIQLPIFSGIQRIENNIELLRKAAFRKRLEDLDYYCEGALEDNNIDTFFDNLIDYSDPNYRPVSYNLEVLIPNNGFNRSGWCPIASGHWGRETTRWSVVTSDHTLAQKQKTELWRDTLRNMRIGRYVWDLDPSTLLSLIERLKAYQDILQVAKRLYPEVLKEDVDTLAEKFHKKVPLPRTYFGDYWCRDKYSWYSFPCEPLRLCKKLEKLRRLEKNIFPENKSRVPLAVPALDTVEMLLAEAKSWRILGSKSSDECLTITYGYDRDDVHLRVDAVIDGFEVGKRVRSAKFYRASEENSAPLIKSKLCSLVVFTLLEYIRKHP